jgi:hypothetical protein
MLTEGRRKPLLSPWERICRAHYNGTGLQLTSEEVCLLAGDGAIRTTASNYYYGSNADDEPATRNTDRPKPPWID